MLFSEIDFSEITYIKLEYTSANNKLREVNVQRETIGSDVVRISFPETRFFQKIFPQKVLLKLVTNNGMIKANAEAKSYVVKNGNIYLSVVPDAEVEKQQKREYYRVYAKKPMAIKFRDENGILQKLISFTADISIGGVRSLNIQNCVSGNRNVFDFHKCSKFVIAVKTDKKNLFVSEAVFIRTCLTQGVVTGYAFQFINTAEQQIEILSKFVAQQQQTKNKNQKTD